MRKLFFELKTEEIEGKGCKMWSFVICTACQILGYQRTVAKWVRNVAWMGVKVILNRFLIWKWEGKSPFIRPVWIWEDNIEIDFKKLYEDGFWVFMVWESTERHCRELCKFYKILGDILIKLSNHWHPSKYCIRVRTRQQIWVESNSVNSDSRVTGGAHGPTRVHVCRSSSRFLVFFEQWTVKELESDGKF